MFDIGFFELALIFVIGLVVLGPTRLPVAIRTVMGWIATVRGLANNVQNELKQELKLQELQESIKKAEQFNLQQLSPELGKTVEELKTSAEKLRTALDEKAAATNTTLAEQVEAIKQSVEPTVKHAAEQQAEHAVEPTESHEETISEMTALSPAEQAELAEAQDEMAHIKQYYPDDDMMDDPVLPASHSQSQLQDKKA
ncbi:Sec-independent protein translocase protein TatB [Pasteurella sp. PK-2025]|uniref:Sec-independent protein translocase protein TatB n=1 Tax=unclassified Pasteurella TaxID=2621516 RepID=UPI003C78B40B